MAIVHSYVNVYRRVYWLKNMEFNAMKPGDDSKLCVITEAKLKVAS